MKTTQDIDNLFEMMNESINEDLSIPETNLREIDKKYQDEKLKEQNKIRNRFIFAGIVFITYLIFGDNLQSKINIILFLPFLAKMIWINQQAKKVLMEQNKAVSFTEFETKRNQITQIFYNQFKRLRTPIYLAILIGACVNFYFIIKSNEIFDIVGNSILTVLGCFLTVTAIRSLIKKYRTQD